jgi:hypothetical protein
MRIKSKPVILMLLCASVIIIVSLACNYPRNEGGNPTLAPRADDGSVSGSYHPPDGLCRDDTVNFDFLYHVNITGNWMTFTPVGEVEDYYSFELTKQ